MVTRRSLLSALGAAAGLAIVRPLVSLLPAQGTGPKTAVTMEEALAAAGFLDARNPMTVPMVSAEKIRLTWCYDGPRAVYVLMADTLLDTTNPATWHIAQSYGRRIQDIPPARRELLAALESHRKR